MKMNSNKLKSLSNKIDEVIQNITPPDTNSTHQKHRKMFFRCGKGFELKDESLNLFNSILYNLLNKENLGEKYSEKFLAGKLQEIVSLVFQGKSNSENLLISLIKEFEDYNIEQTVYIPLAGIEIENPIEIGTVELVKMNDEIINSILDQVNDIIEQTTNAPEEKNKYKIDNEQHLKELFRSKVCAKYKVIAEENRAKERAEEETRRVLDLILFSAFFLYTDNIRVNVGLFGELIREIRPSLGISKNNCYSFNSEVAVIPQLHFL
jgi:succinate dehydrogenase flavin-adding protein (antitoxin of CptAB toxin-antitoxin module)